MSDIIVLDDKIVATARKSHFCDVCEAAILPGESYKRLRQITEGEPNIYRAHLDCWELGRAFCDATGDDIVTQLSSWHEAELAELTDAQREEWERLLIRAEERRRDVG